MQNESSNKLDRDAIGTVTRQVSTEILHQHVSRLIVMVGSETAELLQLLYRPRSLKRTNQVEEGNTYMPVHGIEARYLLAMIRSYIRMENVHFV